jgi:hypothetical protein
LLRWAHFTRRQQLRIMCMSSKPMIVTAADLEGFELQHWPYPPFDGLMVRLNDVVEVFDPPAFLLR